MPAFIDILQPEEIKQVAAYVVSLTARRAMRAFDGGAGQADLRRQLRRLPWRRREGQPRDRRAPTLPTRSG
jgi:hypothetical protein